MKKVLLSLAALAAIGLVAVGCSNSSSGAKDEKKTEKPQAPSAPQDKKELEKNKKDLDKKLNDFDEFLKNDPDANKIVEKFKKLSEDATKALKGSDKAAADDIINKMKNFQLVALKKLKEKQAIDQLNEKLNEFLEEAAKANKHETFTEKRMRLGKAIFDAFEAVKTAAAKLTATQTTGVAELKAAVTTFEAALKAMKDDAECMAVAEIKKNIDDLEGDGLKPASDALSETTAATNTTGLIDAVIKSSGGQSAVEKITAHIDAIKGKAPYVK